MFIKKIKQHSSRSYIRMVYNAIMLVLLCALWISVLSHGILGAFSWGVLKLIVAPLGICLLIINLIFVITGVLKKKKLFHRVISLFLSILLASPILLLMNVIPMAYPIHLEDANPKVTIHSPFYEDINVGWGGDTVEHNLPHVIWASERWAYDLVAEPYNTGSKNLDDYGIYNKDIFSPVVGKVIATYDGEDDILPNTDEFISLEGNYVYIEIEETKTFLLLNHLKKSSVKVNVGDMLKVGDYIGKVGNSGSTSEPHLHIHHQRQNPIETVHPIIAEGLPLFFYTVDNKSIMPVAGEILKSSKDTK